MLSVQVMQPPVCGHKMLLSVYHASHKMHDTLINQSHHIWCVSHHIVTLPPLTCCSPPLWETVMTLTFNLPNTANCQSNLELKVGINIQILKLHKPNIASIKIKTVKIWLMNYCQAPGPVPGQSQNSYSDSQRKYLG